MGLGLHGGGLATVKWLNKQRAIITVTDLKTRKQLKDTLEKLKNYKVKKYVLGRHDQKDFETADYIIKNPGVPKDSRFLNIARKNNIPIETDISIFLRRCPVRVIGVTGTKGKSTTASLIYLLCKEKYENTVLGGNIRKSPLDLLPQINEKTLVVLELSSWQLEDMDHIKKSPYISVITNIMPDHLNRYDSMAEYINSKKLIFKYQNNEDVAILNADNPITKKVAQTIQSRKILYSHNYIKHQPSVYVKNGWIKYRSNNHDSIIMPTKDVKVPGRHNLENVLSAIAVAKTLNIDNQTIRKVVKSFKGIANRLELVRTWNGIKFYNDTTATAPDAVIAGLKSFTNKVVLIAGGADKKLEYTKMAKEIKISASFVILIKGQASQKIAKELRLVGYNNFKYVANMDEAVDMAVKHCDNETRTVLLSPGAASFGVFVNEFDRGEKFKQKVKKLK